MLRHLAQTAEATKAEQRRQALEGLRQRAAAAAAAGEQHDLARGTAYAYDDEDDGMGPALQHAPRTTTRGDFDAPRHAYGSGGGVRRDAYDEDGADHDD